MTTKLIQAADERETAKETLRNALRNLPDGVRYADLCRATGGDVLPQSIHAFAAGAGLGDERLDALESAMRKLGVLK